MFGGKAVVDREHRSPGDAGKVCADEVIKIHVAPDPAAAMVVDDQGGEITDLLGALLLKEISADHSSMDWNDERLGGDAFGTLSQEPADNEIVGDGYIINLFDA